MERTNFTDDDEGKSVVNSNGDEIGVVSEVEGDTARVNPDPGITDTIRAKLGWRDPTRDDYVLEADRVGVITDDEIRLKG